ncbi:hypothetical protein H0H92_005240 [Tricholoma furcatifolium]|nr:hypothetical protein H0H92_005240 [Tricholoma furcatifolium]
MHSRSFFVAFLTLALASFTAQAAPAPNNNQEECSIGQVTTILHTVTVTANSASSTSGSSNNKNNNNNNNNNKGSTTTSSAAASTTTANNQASVNTNNGGQSNNNHNNGFGSHNGFGNNNNNNNSGKSNSSSSVKSSTSTSAASSAQTTAAAVAAVSVSTTVSSTATTTSSAVPLSTSCAASLSAEEVTAAQSSTTLNPCVIAPGFANNGQDVVEAGQVPSLTSTNNFINFCLTVPDLPLTNGSQITTGSCNPAPIGIIPSTSNMPSAKFAFPTNFGTIQANTAFTVVMNIQNLETGFFVNAEENYFAAPQQLNSGGQIQGHSHVVIEALSSLQQTTPSDPTTFAFFKGLNDAAVNGQLTANVTAGLPAGVYKISSINTGANHAPVIVPIAQHGSLDDVIYFTVTDDGNPANSTTTSASAAAAATSTAATSASASASSTASATSAAEAAASTTDSAAGTSTSAAATATASASAAATSATGKQKGNATSSASASASAAASTSSAAASASASATSSAQAAASTDKSSSNKSSKNARELKSRRPRFTFTK